METQRAEIESYAWRVIRGMFAGIGWGLLGFFLTPLAVCPPFVDWLCSSALGEVSPAHDLLTGYLRSYWGVLSVFGIGALILIRLIITAVIRFFRNRLEETRLKEPLENRFTSLTYLSGFVPEHRRGELKKLLDQLNSASIGRFGDLFMSIALAVSVLFFYSVVLFEGGATSAPIAPQIHIPALQAELAQVENGDLETAVVWIHPKVSTAHLPGPWQGGYRSLVRNYHVVGFDTDGQWVEIYVPDALDFSLNLKRPYRESQSIVWNLENAQRYQIQYTSNYHLVVEITPVD